MSLDTASLLTRADDQCPGCNNDFSPIPESDGARTYLSCGHSVCWKCIQTEWCKSSSHDVDLVNCPLCNDEVLICFEGEDSAKVDDKPLESAMDIMSEVLQKTQMHNQPSTSIPCIQPTSGCSDVLMCQTSDGYITSGNFPDIPQSIADSIIDMAEIGSGMDFPSTDPDESLHDGSWSMDIMNFQDMLEQNDATQHLSQDSIFSDQSDNDMGSVQDILKIANMPGDSLLDDASLGAIFLPDISNETGQSSDKLKISLTNSEFSPLLHPAKTISSQSLSHNHCNSNFEGVEIHIKDAGNGCVNDFEQVSVDQRNLLEKLEAENSLLQENPYLYPKKPRPRRRYGSRSKKRKEVSDLIDMDNINRETLSAVASIQDDCTSYTSTSCPSLPQKRKPDIPDKLISLKENLHQRFYPKSNRRLDRSALEMARVDRRRMKRIFIPSRDEIEIPDMQMVKIVSDVQLPEVKEQPPALPEDPNNHNYGYVKNSLLPNGNEIKNLYVVPKTWLNNDEVEVQFAPTRKDFSVMEQVAQHISKPIETSLESLSPSFPVLNAFQTQQMLLPPVSTLPINQQTLLPENAMPIMLQETDISNSLHGHAVPKLFHENEEQILCAETITQNIFNEADMPKLLSENAVSEKKDVNSTVLKPLCENKNSSAVKTTIAKSLLDHTHKVIKVWSKDKDPRPLGKEVHITQLPKHEELISNDNFETEMVHVRYEINDDQIVFIPEEEDDSSNNEKDTNEITENERGPLLILTVQDSESSSTEVCDVENVRTSNELETDADNTPAKTGRQQRSMTLKSILQSDDFFPPPFLQLNALDHKDKAGKQINTAASESTSAFFDNEVQVMPGGPVSRRSLNSSASRPPTASSSNASCQRLFSSPESVRPEDIQEWYKSGDNSIENSNIEMQPWEEFETHLLLQDEEDYTAGNEADLGLPETKDQSLEKTEMGQTIDVSCDLFAVGETKQTCTELGIKQYYVNEQSSKPSGTYMDLSSTALITSGTFMDGTDYGSPPELERMVTLPQESTPLSANSRKLKQPKLLLPDSECAVFPDDPDTKKNTPVEEVNNFTKPLNHHSQNDMLEEILDQLYELTKESETKSNIHMLICQIYKIKEINIELTGNAGLENDQRQKLFDTIVNQVSSVIACETSAHLLDANVGIYEKDIEKRVFKQKVLLKKVVEHGVELVISLTAEYEKTAGRTNDSSLEISTSGCEDSLRLTPRKVNECLQLKEENNDTDPASTLGHTSVGEPLEITSQENDETLQPDRAPSHLLLGNSLKLVDDADKRVEHSIEKHDGLDIEYSLAEFRIPSRDEGEQTCQDVAPSKSTSGTNLIDNVSNIALNVEIGSSTSTESVLPSLSYVLKETNIYEEIPEIVNREKYTMERNGGHKLDPAYEEDKENSSGSSKECLDDDDDDDDDDDEEETEEEGDKDEDFQPRIRSARPARQLDDNTMKRKLQCLYDDEEDVAEPNSSSTPKKRRGNTSKGSSTPSKNNKTTMKKSGKKKKKGKTKDIYASSSEEVIPPPVKRGFQYTEECFKVFNTVYNHELSDSFCKEIKSADVPGYYKVVKRAMWLDLIAQKLRTGRYGCLEEYVADMRLVFENSRRFNKKNSEVYESGLVCQKLFEETLAEQFPDKKL